MTVCNLLLSTNSWRYKDRTWSEWRSKLHLPIMPMEGVLALLRLATKVHRWFLSLPKSASRIHSCSDNLSLCANTARHRRRHIGPVRFTRRFPNTRSPRLQYWPGMGIHWYSDSPAHTNIWKNDSTCGCRGAQDSVSDKTKSGLRKQRRSRTRKVSITALWSLESYLERVQEHDQRGRCTCVCRVRRVGYFMERVMDQWYLDCDEPSWSRTEFVFFRTFFFLSVLWCLFFCRMLVCPTCCMVG